MTIRATPNVRARARTTGICAYCGALGKVTEDHIPPRNLFIQPYTPDLITVPCCDDCRKGTSKDDEYFRVALSRRSDVAAHPTMRQLAPDIERSLRRIAAQRFAQAVDNSTVFRTFVTESGFDRTGVGISALFRAHS